MFVKKILKTKKQQAVVLGLTAVFVFPGFQLVHAVTSSELQAQINQLNSQNSQNQANVNNLRSQASSYQDAINKLQSQISAIEQAIGASQNKQAQLQAQITQAQNDITSKKASLSADLKAMYVDGTPSTIEMLATSNNISDYVDKQEYRTRVQNSIQGKLKEIAALQAQLQQQKVQVDQLIKDQRAQESQLAGDRAEQNRLLGLNQGQQDAYNRDTASNSSKIKDLQKQQAALNARFTSGSTGGPAGSGPTCGGGYPAKWCQIEMDSVLDTWGMYNRECVSYTAFRVAASGRNMPGWGWASRGNAKQWDDNAIAAGIPVDGNPQPGDVAISNNGYYGHAMYVESVNANGSINISQYNADWTGRYSTNTISPSGLAFIHF